MNYCRSIKASACLDSYLTYLTLEDVNFAHVEIGVPDYICNLRYGLHMQTPYLQTPCAWSMVQGDSDHAGLPLSDFLCARETVYIHTFSKTTNTKVP